MAVAKRRTSKTRKAKRRTHVKLPKVTLAKDPVTGDWKLPHRVDRDKK